MPVQTGWLWGFHTRDDQSWRPLCSWCVPRCLATKTPWITTSQCDCFYDLRYRTKTNAVLSHVLLRRTTRLQSGQTVLHLMTSLSIRTSLQCAWITYRSTSHSVAFKKHTISHNWTKRSRTERQQQPLCLWSIFSNYVFTHHSKTWRNQTPFKSDRRHLIGSNTSARNRVSQWRALRNCNLVCSGSAGLSSPTVLR